MTTEATQNPQPPQPPVMDVTEVYRTLGRLEAEQQLVKEILVRIEQRLDRQDQRIDRLEENGNRQFGELTRRIDRLWYTIIGIGAALAVGLILQSVLGS